MKNVQNINKNYYTPSDTLRRNPYVRFPEAECLHIQCFLYSHPLGFFSYIHIRPLSYKY
jgi:hypothetical protein